MADNTIHGRITSKNDTKTNWTTNNPVLLKGEIGIEFDPDATTNGYVVKAKVGDGTTPWNSLPYLAGDPITIPTADGNSILDDSGNWKLYGWDGATNGQYPTKNTITGKILWQTPNWATSAQLNAHISDHSNPHQVTAAQVGALPTSTKYGASISLGLDSDYKITAMLKDQDGNVLGTAQTIDLPLESVVVNGSYDSATKEVVLTLENGNAVRFSVADLVSGLQSEITVSNKLDGDLVTVATTSKLGTVKIGTAANTVGLNSSNVMTVNNIETSKLVDFSGGTLILDCGSSTS